MSPEEVLRYIEKNNLTVSRNFHPLDVKAGKIWSCGNRVWSGQFNYTTRMAWGSTLSEAVENYAQGKVSKT